MAWPFMSKVDGRSPNRICVGSCSQGRRPCHNPECDVTSPWWHTVVRMVVVMAVAVISVAVVERFSRTIG